MLAFGLGIDKVDPNSLLLMPANDKVVTVERSFCDTSFGQSRLRPWRHISNPKLIVQV